MKTHSKKQNAFFRSICKSNTFKNNVLQRAEQMGMDGAFYFTIGEFQSKTNNFSFDDLDDEEQDLFIGEIIQKFPELEF